MTRCVTTLFVKLFFISTDYSPKNLFFITMYVLLLIKIITPMSHAFMVFSLIIALKNSLFLFGHLLGACQIWTLGDRPYHLLFRFQNLRGIIPINLQSEYPPPPADISAVVAVSRGLAHVTSLWLLVICDLYYLFPAQI